MTDAIAAASRAASNNDGVAAISRLADRLAAVAPPAAAANLTAPAPFAPRFSPAVTAALSTTAALAAEADRRARRSRSITGSLVRNFVAVCSLIPYALVALALRLAIARVFFLDGQTRVDGPLVPVNLHGFDFSFVVPLQVKAETFTTFLTRYAPLPVPPVLAAYVVSGAEFVLPIMLVVGFGTRMAALGLLIITALIQIYVMPEALWSQHVYWASILLVLLSCGPGQLSVDHFVRLASRN
jgi:putative oxidoreductase